MANADKVERIVNPKCEQGKGSDPDITDCRGELFPMSLWVGDWKVYDLEMCARHRAEAIAGGHVGQSLRDRD